MYVSGEIMGAYDVSAHRLSASAYLADLITPSPWGTSSAKMAYKFFRTRSRAIATDRGRDHDEAIRRGAP
jgi:hypothetical protein